MSNKLTTCKDIAVVGIALRFPNGINSLDHLWELLSSGGCAISEIPTNRWPTDLYQDSIKSIPGRSLTFKAGVLDNIKDFDASFFGISPKEAEWLDPQQRLLLEVTQECLEDAGIKVSEFKGSDCGVYTGISSLDYGLQAPKDLPSISAYTMTGNTLSIASNRISYVFDLHGPSVSMDTACSSSLVSLHHACQAIRAGEVPCAIVAGAHLLQDPYSFVGFSKASMLSPTGTCHPFANDANGYVRSEGVAVLLLKPLEDAIRDNNKIHAVIKASGVNTDGSRKNGLTIPSDVAQTELMEKVLFQSGLQASDIDYVEAHGTGTPVGDPIEAKSISSVYAVNGQRDEVLPISSAKGNLGHMEPMSGLASFIKAVLSLKHGLVPPISFDFVPNPNIDFDKLNIQCTPKGLDINAKNIRTAGVNSFGFGGANAHVILQNYCADNSVSNYDISNDFKSEIGTIANITDTNKKQKIANYVLFVSAKSKQALKNLCKKHIEAIESLESKELHLTNRSTEDSKNETEDRLLRAYTYKALSVRDAYACRVVFTGTDKESLIAEIKNFIADKTSSRDTSSSIRISGASTNIDNALSFTYAENFNDYHNIAFVFNGNGSQYIGMGANLYKECSIFAECIDELSDKIEAYIDFSIKNLLSGAYKDSLTGTNKSLSSNVDVSNVDASNGYVSNAEFKDIIQNTKIAQPLIFAIQVALCKVLQINGITPKAVIGHSMGEIAAAYVSSKLTLDEAIKVICVRSMLQDTTRGQGRMAAVSVSKNDFNNICNEMYITDVSVAAINSADNITISGNTSSLALLENYFVSKKIFFKLLDVDYPFHSSFMDVIKDRVLNELNDIAVAIDNRKASATVSFYSSVTGTKCEDNFLLDNTYWWRNIREEVNFCDGVKSLLEDGIDYLIEIGSNAILQRYLRDITKLVSEKHVIAKQVTAKQVIEPNIVKDNNGLFSPKITSTLLQKSDNLARMINVAMECHLSCMNLDKSCFFNGFDVNNISYITSNQQWVSNKQLLDSIELPHYAWEKKHYEYHNSTEKPVEHFREYPLLGWKLNSSTSSSTSSSVASEYLWENVLEPSKSALLRDHIVDGQYVVAAADYIEIVLEAIDSISGNSKNSSETSAKSKKSGEPSEASEKVLERVSEQDSLWFNVEYLDILSPITMGGEECYKSIRVRISANTQDFEILSRDYLSNDEWVLNVKGRLLPTSVTNELVNSPYKEFCESCVYSLDSRDIYELTNKLGLTYGANFRLLEKVDIDESEKMLKVYLAPRSENSDNNDTSDGSSKYVNNSSEYIVHPGIIDASFQGLLATIIGNHNRKYNRNDNDYELDSLNTYLPVKFGNISVRKSNNGSQQTPEPSFVIGKLLKISSRSLLAEFRLFNAKNECLAILENCRFNVLPKANNKCNQNELNGAAHNISSWHYEQQPVHHDLLSFIDDEEFSPTKVKEFLVNLNLPERFTQQRTVWFESVLPLIENAVLYYSLTSLKTALSSFDSFALSEALKESLHPLVLYIIDLLVDHNLVAIDDNNKIKFISGNEESSGDEILRYAYDICPEAIYEILPIYRLGNKLPLIVSKLLECNLQSENLQASDLLESPQLEILSSSFNGSNSFNATPSISSSLSTNTIAINTLDYSVMNSISSLNSGNSMNFSNLMNSMQYSGIYKALAELTVKLKQTVANNKHILRVLELGNNGIVQTIVKNEFNGNLSNVEIYSLEDSDFASSNLSIKDEKIKQIKCSHGLGQLDHNTFDLIVIDEQLRYVRDYEQALLNLEKLLSKKGLLVVIERNSDWSANVLNGLDKSWWLADNSSILKASSYWESLLQSSSFKDTVVYTEPTSAGIQAGLYLICARKDLNYININNKSIIKSTELIPSVSDNTPLDTFEGFLEKLDNQDPTDSIASDNENILFIVPKNYQSENSEQTIDKTLDKELVNILLADKQVNANITYVLCDSDFNIVSSNIEYEEGFNSDNSDAQFDQLLKSTLDKDAFNKVVFVATCTSIQDESNTPYELQKLTKLANYINELNSNATSKLSAVQKNTDNNGKDRGHNIALSVITFNANVDPSASAIRGVVRVISNELANVNINSINIELPCIASLVTSVNCLVDLSNESTANSDFVCDFDITPIWRELLASDGLDEVTIELSKVRNVKDCNISRKANNTTAGNTIEDIAFVNTSTDNKVDARYRTVIKEGYSDLASSKLNRSDLSCCDSDGCALSSCSSNASNSCVTPAFTTSELPNVNISEESSKAYYLDFTAPGRLKNLCWVEKQLPKSEELAPNEVIVDVKVTGVNFRDIMMTMGLVPDDALENGFSGPHLGLEFSGVISALGSNVKDFKIGDRVLGFGSCCFSNKLVVNDYSIASIPNEWSFELAATAPIVFFTAWYAISTLANMEKGESILIHGAAGGVGIAAIQIAQYLGLEIYATAGSESKRDFLRMLGVEHIYNSRELDFRTELLRDTNGQGVDAVLNCLSGEAMRESLSVLKPFGRFMELGKRDFVENTSLGLRYFKENISYFAIDVDQLFKFNPTKAKNIFNQVINLFKNGDFTPLPYIAFSNTDIVNAFKYMQQGNQTGKVVVTYDEAKSSINIESPINIININKEEKTANTNDSRNINKEENRKDNVSDECHAGNNLYVSNLRDLNNIISSEDVWLITGGTRGFGWATAKYLLDVKKVKQVVLVSRSGMTDESVIKESRQYLSLSNNGLNKDSNTGTTEDIACTESISINVNESIANAERIIVKRCDVSDKNALEALWNDLLRDNIKVTGIIHAAAVFADCLLKDITLEHYQKVWNSKYIGAKNLHEVSKTSTSVKNFVVYSSISVAIGNIGQANYVATNSALEALVNRRIQEGYNACCIEWGPISDVGYLNGNEQVKKSLELAIGAEALNSADALAQLPEVIVRGGTQIVANLNWASIGESVGKVPSRIYSLVQASNNQYQSISTSDLLSVIKDKAMTKDKAINIVADILVTEIADTMGFTTDQINKEQNLQDIGLDSLMAMDLIVSIEKQTGIKLSVMAFQDNPNVNKLALKIYEKMVGNDEESEGAKDDKESIEVSENFEVSRTLETLGALEELGNDSSNNSNSVLRQVLTTHVQSSDLNDFLVDKNELLVNKENNKDFLVNEEGKSND